MGVADPAGSQCVTEVQPWLIRRWSSEPQWMCPGGLSRLSAVKGVVMSKQNAVAVMGLALAGFAVAGWVQLAPLPAGSAGRGVGDGGWLVWDSLTGQLYAAKGCKCCEFFSWDPAHNLWQSRTDIPYGPEAKPPACGAAGTAGGNGQIFAVKGNNSLGFHRYNAAGNAWTQLADVPLGSQAKRCKGGTDLTFVPGPNGGQVFLLKGMVRDFFRFEVATGSWRTMADAPVGNAYKWAKGSWLAYDGNGMIYAHKAGVHELHRYDVRSGTWLEPALAGMPFFSRITGAGKRSRAGAAGVFLRGKLYAFKGGNTQEFWRFDPQTMTWTELETIPRLGAQHKKRKVKGGGDLCTDGRVIYALKGAKTLDCWMYVPETVALGGSGPAPQRRVNSAVAAGRVWAHAVRPGVLRVEWCGLSQCRPVVVAVFDPAGRKVLQQECEPARAGWTELATAGLPRGTYLVRLSGEADIGCRVVLR